MTAQDYRSRKAIEISFRRWLVGSSPARALVAILLEQDPSAYRSYLESQFAPSMAWENYGHVWQVDHVVALSAFDLRDPSDVRLAWGMDNLRPLTVTANKVRGASAADSLVALQTRQPVSPLEHGLLVSMAERAFALAYPGVTLCATAQ